MIHPDRILTHGTSQSGSYILYWMQSAVRTRYNHALEYAIRRSHELHKPLIVIFCLYSSYPSVTPRSWNFLLEGLADVSVSLHDRGISFQVFDGDPKEVIPGIADDASLLVMDQGWTRVQRDWREQVLAKVSCQSVIVEANLIVPVETVSPKEEWSAATFRRKINRMLPDYLVPLTQEKVRYPSSDEEPFPEAMVSADHLMEKQIPAGSGCTLLKGGERAALAQLNTFLSGKIDRYDSARNDPTARATSLLSAYLHFGHISPLDIAMRVNADPGPGTAAFLEQLIVRRELAYNFVWYNPAYDQYTGLPAWAQKTLDKHRSDSREYEYTLREFEQGLTHDRVWNAMQQELVTTGYLHGYLRMYWGKKILEWSQSPDDGYSIAVTLNDHYQLDGRDPNGYTGVAWCFGKHDRPWKERPVFGMIRYMNEAGLRRKFRVDGWCERAERLAAECRDQALTQ